MWTTLERMAKEDGHSFGGAFDPELGKVVVQGTASVAEMAHLTERYPDHFEYQHTDDAIEPWRREVGAPDR